MEVAGEIAKLGYDVVLFDGNSEEGTHGAGVKTAIQQALGMPHALPGEVAWVGFSLGGGESLYYGTQWPDQVGARWSGTRKTHSSAMCRVLRTGCKCPLSRSPVERTIFGRAAARLPMTLRSRRRQSSRQAVRPDRVPRCKSRFRQGRHGRCAQYVFVELAGRGEPALAESARTATRLLTDWRK